MYCNESAIRPRNDVRGTICGQYNVGIVGTTTAQKNVRACPEIRANAPYASCCHVKKKRGRNMLTLRPSFRTAVWACRPASGQTRA